MLRPFSRLLLAALTFALPSAAQVITTVVGNALNDNQAATSTTLVRPGGVAIDGQGNIYVTDTHNFVVRRVDPRTGNTSIVAGGGHILDINFPTPARSAALSYPQGPATDLAGNLYFTEPYRRRVVKLAPDGNITTVAGTGNCAELIDSAPANALDLCFPYAVATDRSGNLYIADDDRVIVINVTTNVARRLAGSADSNGGFSGDGGLARNALLNDIYSLLLDGQGNVYLTDSANQRVRRIDADTGIIRTVAGTGDHGFSGDNGPATAARLAAPSGLALDAAGNLLIADRDSGRIRRVDARTGIITTLAGGGPDANSRRENIPALSAAFVSPQAVAVDSSGNIFVVDAITSLVRRIDSSGLVSTAVGTSDVRDGSLAVDAPLLLPYRMAFDQAGNLYFAEPLQNRVRRVEAATGRISTVAGTGAGGFSGDGGPARDATLTLPRDVFVNAAGELFIVDGDNCRIRKVAGGIITTFAGTTCGFGGDGGPATAAQLNVPRGIVGSSGGTIFIADTENSRIRSVDPQGVIRTIANLSQIPAVEGAAGLRASLPGETPPGVSLPGETPPGVSLPGETPSGVVSANSLAARSHIPQPIGMAIDGSGNLLVADEARAVVRRINLTNNAVTTLAGTGECGTGGDGGPATQALICAPTDVAVDAQGNVYISDSGNAAIRRVAPSGTITTFAGTLGELGFSGDGNLATRALLNDPAGVSVDAAGNVFISDTGNARIRKVILNQQPLPALVVSPRSLTFTVPAGTQPTPRTIEIANVNAGAMNWSASVSTSSGGNWLTVSPTSGAASPSSNATVAVNITGLAAGTYQGTITVTVAGATGSPAVVPVTVTLGENATARPGVSAQFLRFFVIQGATAPGAQVLAITSPSSGTLNWSASAATSDGGSWLQISPASGVAPSILNVSVAPTGLAPGAYLGLVSVRNTASSEVFPVAISLVVSAPASALLPSQSSFVFNVVEGATRPAPQTLAIFNAGQGTMSWNIQSIIPTGGNWLTVSPTSGSSAAGAAAPPPVALSVNPAGLAAGVYGAVLVISSAGATNSPALVTVLMNVLRAGTPPAPVVDPAGLAFIAAGASAPQQQTLRLSSTGGAAMAFTVSARTADGLAWLSVSPTSGQVASSGEVINVTVTATPGQLSADVRQGTITITPGGGTPVDVPVVFVVTPGVGPSGKGWEELAACAPTRQFVTPLGQVGNNFSLLLGWPAPLRARVVDDCGNEVSRATVTASFSTEGGTVVLNSLGNGTYSGNWTPSASGAAVSVNIKSLAPPLPETNMRLAGSTRAGSVVPVVPANAAVNGASFAKLTADGPPAPLAPGSIFSLFGSNLATAVGGAVSLPLPRTLQDATLKIGGVDAPLFYVSPGQINAQVPNELAGRSTASIAVTVRGTVSGTETVTLAPVQPGLFSTAASGAGQGAILDAEGRLVDAASPVRAGDVIQIFATGLGATSPSVATGAAAPGAEPLARVNTAVQVRIGGAEAEVLFAGLAPGFVGLYQVNARIPTVASTGNAVPVTLSVGAVTSNQVTIAIR